MADPKSTKYTLSVKNFQSLRNVVIELEGLTVLFGAQSNIGKSSFVRALDGLLFGSCTKDYITRGESSLGVSLAWDDHRIALTKGAAENDYTVDGVDYSKVGREVPPIVSELGFRPATLKDLEVNLQVRKQFDKAFPLILSSGDMGKVVGSLVQTEKVYSASKALLSDSSKSRTKAGRLQVQVLDKEQELEQLRFVDDLSTAVDAIDVEGIRDLVSRVESVRALVKEGVILGSEQLELQSVKESISVDEAAILKYLAVMDLLTTRKVLKREEEALQVLLTDCSCITIDMVTEVNSVVESLGLIRERRVVVQELEDAKVVAGLVLPSSDSITLILNQLQEIPKMRKAIFAVEEVEAEMVTAGVAVCSECGGTGLVQIA